MSNTKIFLITILSLALFLVAPINKAKAVDQFGCCSNSNSSQKILSFESDCKGFGETWTAGPCPASSPSVSGNSPGSLQSGCKLENGKEICSLENPLSSGTSVEGIISVVIKSALGIIGALTLLMLVWGGFQWLTSAGNPEKVKSGTQTMVWAIIGVVLVFVSYLLLSTFTNYLTGTP